MTLVSGKYLTKVERSVVVWPAPDANGDGKEIWVPQLDAQGREVGRLLEKDKHGNEVREYKAPEGFQNRPGYDHTDNYVKVDERGEVVRKPDGEAICIKPGQALVFNADGTVEVLQDEYSQYVFTQANDSVNADANAPADADAPADVEVSAEEDPRDARIKELEELLKEKSPA